MTIFVNFFFLRKTLVIFNTQRYENKSLNNTKRVLYLFFSLQRYTSLDSGCIKNPLGVPDERWKLTRLLMLLITNYGALSHYVTFAILLSLSKDVFERRMSTGSGIFSFLHGGFAKIFGLIVSIIVKTFRNTNLVVSRCSLLVGVRRSKTPLLKLPNYWCRKTMKRRPYWFPSQSFEC